MKKSIQHLILGATMVFSSIGTATLAYAHEEMQMGNQGKPMAGQNAMSEGEIKKVDKDAGKLTIKHGELKSVGMPAMTMAFKVKDAAMLDQVKQGDKVHFVVEKVGGTYTITNIEAVK